MAYDWKENIEKKIPWPQGRDGGIGSNIWNWDRELDDYTGFYGPEVIVHIKSPKGTPFIACYDTGDDLNETLARSLEKTMLEKLFPTIESCAAPFESCFLGVCFINEQVPEPYLVAEINFVLPGGNEEYTKLKEWVESESTCRLVKEAAIKALQNLATESELPIPELEAEITRFGGG